MLFGPKVSFASVARWGTEPEGWYVDLPYAVFLVGVNYSPLECRRSNRGAKFVSIQIAGARTPRGVVIAPCIYLVHRRRILCFGPLQATRPLDL